jgi:hypothetical protein
MLHLASNPFLINWLITVGREYHHPLAASGTDEIAVCAGMLEQPIFMEQANAHGLKLGAGPALDHQHWVDPDKEIKRKF